MALGRTRLENMALRELAAPEMRFLSRETGEAVAAIGASLPEGTLPDGGPDWLGSLGFHAAAGVTNRLAKA